MGFGLHSLAWRSATLGVYLAAMASCGDDNSSPSDDTIAKAPTNSGDGQTGPVGQALANALRVLVTVDGEPQPDVSVTWSTTDGSVAPTSVATDADGISATTWTLGPTTGEQTAQATLEGATGSPVTFTATAGSTTPAGTLQVIQAAESTAVIDVMVDGDVVIQRLAAGAVSTAVSVPAGLREISFRPLGAPASPNELQLSVVADSTYTTVVIDSASVLEPIVLADTGSVPAAGRTKLRVANFAALAGPIDVYRRQPDFDGIVTLVFPFTYQQLSNYVESDPGDWQVLIATEARVNGVPPDVPQDTLLIVDPVSLAADQASTVVIIDEPGGGLDAVIVRDR